MILGSLGDAASTLYMMGTGLFEEANPTANHLMDAFGVKRWVLAVTAICLTASVFLITKPARVYAWAVWAAIATVGVVKLYTAVSNLVLLVDTQ